MYSWSSPLGGSAKTATRFDTPLCTRSAASSAPAPPESSDKTMMSADVTGSFTTSAHPAARRTGSRREGIATIANAANASTTRIGAHLGQLKIILGFIGSLNESAMSPAGKHRPCSAKMAIPMLARQRLDASRHPRRRHSGPRSSVALGAQHDERRPSGEVAALPGRVIGFVQFGGAHDLALARVEQHDVGVGADR